MGRLIDEMIRAGYLTTPRIIAAFRAVDRRDFIPAVDKNHAYENRPIPIGYGQTTSQPMVVAFMLELLAPQEGENILEVGSGAGWQTALLAHLVGEQGRVVSIERVRQLHEMAREHLSAYPYSNIALVHADGSYGYAPAAPYDGIIAGAAAQSGIPDAWRDQCAPDGRIVLPVRGSIVKSVKHKDGTLHSEEYPGFAFVPLISDSDNEHETSE